MTKPNFNTQRPSNTTIPKVITLNAKRFLSKENINLNHYRRKVIPNLYKFIISNNTGHFPFCMLCVVCI